MSLENNLMLCIASYLGLQRLSSILANALEDGTQRPAIIAPSTCMGMGDACLDSMCAAMSLPINWKTSFNWNIVADAVFQHATLAYSP